MPVKPALSTQKGSSALERELQYVDWMSLRYHLAWAYDGTVWPAARVGSYSNMSTSCWLIRKGSVKVMTDGKSTTVKPGQWVFVASPTRHQTFSKDAELLSINFEFTWPGGEQVIDKKSNLVLNAAEHPELEKAALKIARRVAKIFPASHAFLKRQSCSIDRFLQVQNLLPNWISVYLKALATKGVFPVRLGTHDNRIQQALVEIDRHPLCRAFSLNNLHQQVGLSRSRFDSLFIEATGMTARRYYDKRRLNEAKTFLAHTKLSIKEIAASLGFRHASHFSLWFQQQMNLSASTFRGNGHTAE